MAKNEEETEEKTKDKSKANPGFGISSKTYYAAAIIVLVVGAALIGYMAMGQPKEGPATPASASGTKTATPVPAAPIAANGNARTVIEEQTTQPTATLSASWRPNRLRCYSSSDCFAKDGYCRTRLLTGDLGDPIPAGKNCVCVGQSCQVAS